MIPSPPLPGVRHHVCLQARGGASKAARLLLGALADAGAICSLSCETPEADARGQPEELRAIARAPADVGRDLPDGAIVHLHASAAPALALESLAGLGLAVAVTAHDCAWLTGGCAFPLECRGYENGCPDPCPRKFPDSGQVHAAMRRAMERARPLLIAPSAWMAALLRQAYPGRGVRVIPNATPWPDKLCSKTAAKARLGLSPAAKTVLFLAHGGEKAAYKGGGAFRDIWEGIKKAVPAAVCLIAGGEQSRREGDIIHLPYLEDEGLSLVYRAADALVYPTLADNHPLIILEAMAHGLPVAAYAAGGIPEQICALDLGLLAPPGDARELTRQAARLLNDPELAKTLADTARLSCRDRFAPARLARDHLKAYQTLIA